MSPSMLDTDILSEFLRGNVNVVKNDDEYLKEFGFISLSIITYYEILNGLLYKDAKKQLKKFENFVALNNVMLLTLKSTKLAANIQAELRKKGRENGHADTLITGIAIANKLQLVTNNTDHFKRIKGLQLANWSR